jgi:GNAT superfamily N-acetyltransferase
MLLSAAELWAEDIGFDSIRLRTNTLRLDAHRFYENAGFKKVKEQFTYVKPLI